jgi:hypothetical protein
MCGSHSAVQHDSRLRCAGSNGVARERRGEMANKKTGKRGAGVIALIAVLAALAGPSAASADPGKSMGKAASAAGNPYAYSYAFSFGVDASWVEE